MSNYIIRVPVEYHIARLNYCEQQLSSLPVIKSGHHGKHKVMRIYSSDRICREISAKSKSWKKASTICKQREQLSDRIKAIKKVLREDYKKESPGPYTLINTENTFDNRFFDSVQDCSCSFEKTESYFYNGRHYRSRAEMDFASLLDLYGLEFKYDVEFYLNGKVYSVDFIIVFREFNRCAFVEYSGKCNDSDYVKRKGNGISHARNSKLYLGRDIFIIDGDKTFTPGADVMRAFIVGIIHQFCAYHIGR